MADIETLVQDIYDLVEGGVIPKNLEAEALDKLGASIARSIKDALSTDNRNHGGTLRMSNIGQPCNRKLWYEVNQPEDKEPLTAPMRLKFLFGHILEDLLLYLAELSGHNVEGRQEELEIEGVLGHRDAIIDGVPIDAKSTSTYSFAKFKEHKLGEDDPFGYITQIQSYAGASRDDPRVTDKSRCGFLAIDKTLGNICLDLYPVQSFPIEKLYQYKKDVISRDEPPSRGFDPVPEGKSGNMKLPMNCSYCDFKKTCHPKLRTFLYARGPVFLTTVRKEPDVPEVTTDIPTEEG